MEAVFVLLAAGAIVGLVLGFYFRWMAIGISGLGLAIVSATVLQNEGFGFLAGIAIIVACLTVNQAAYMIGRIWSVLVRGADKTSPPHDRPNDDPDNDIAREYRRKEDAKSRGERRKSL
jgi:hypothetical protein